VELEDNAVIISGERKEEHEEKNAKWHRVEHSYGSFRRIVQLPAGVDASKATADFKKGVLNVALPKIKPESAKLKSIDITAG
jgi:HSP20 family protein